MGVVRLLCPELLAPLCSLSHSRSLLLLPRVGVEEPSEEDQNELRRQYIRWHEEILRNKLTGPGFSPPSNLTCFSWCHFVSFFLPVCAHPLPLSAKGPEVGSSLTPFPPCLWVACWLGVPEVPFSVPAYWAVCVPTKAGVGNGLPSYTAELSGQSSPFSELQTHLPRVLVMIY